MMATTRLTPVEKQILKEIQDRFPLVQRPYRSIGRKLGIPEKDLIERMRRLAGRGIIRSIRAVINSPRLGLHATLIAMRVPPGRIRRTAQIINAYPQVTHNYLRDDVFNLWFTLSAASRRELGKVIREIRRRTGIRNMLDMRSVRAYKITTALPIE
jgi:DNA-binding Lrp family transcriptional regulator